MKKTIFFVLLVILVLLLFSSFFWLYEARFFVGRASVSRASFSIENSYVFITPLRARANKIEKIRITVFVLDNQGLGVAGKNITLGSDPNLNIEIIQGTTDNFGKAIFDVAATNAGEYYLPVKVDQTTLPQSAHIVYTK